MVAAESAFFVSIFFGKPCFSWKNIFSPVFCKNANEFIDFEYIYNNYNIHFKMGVFVFYLKKPHSISLLCFTLQIKSTYTQLLF